MTVFTHEGAALLPLLRNWEWPGHEKYLSRVQKAVRTDDGEYLLTEAVVTFTAQRQSSSGGGSSSSKLYAILIEDTDGGSTSASRKSAAKGAAVTIFVKPDTGYGLDDLTVTDKDGAKVKLTDKGNGKYAFIMPASKVTVKAGFTKIDHSCHGGADCPSRAFADLSTAAWYHEAVDYVLENGIMSGYADGTFRPNADLSRGMLAQSLYNQAGHPAVSAGSAFSDVPDDMWCSDAVKWAAANGIINGNGSSLDPKGNATRVQVAQMLKNLVDNVP